MGYTVLHSAAYYNTYKIAEFLISFFRRRLALYLKQKYINKKGLQKGEDLDEQTIESIKQRVRDTIKEWVNIQSRGDEGFYPLHFASFHGNVKLIKLLVKCGANIYAKNRQGINMLHVAAQGDQAYSLTYFRDLGIPLTDKDGESSTPLHWACFAGSDTAIYYLLAWGLDVNA
jgi:ankyrin repeat protein